ncbi:MAG: helix-turn-helix transcriptional regulator [Rubrobacter sp.]|jgi:transcriptional regulator with XRE-family HTH domain|nr:helix-turn-helix transcriptional regulator [Rubrobacter sp.]MBA3794170.1 helix-turn-helix transcriptional regulator [Rubrobacter sp.]
MIGEAVRRRREELRLTGAQLAEKAGMAPSAVSQIETGKRTPSSSSVVKLAAALSVEVGDLFPKGQASLPDFGDERRATVYRFTGEQKVTAEKLRGHGIEANDSEVHVLNQYIELRERPPAGPVAVWHVKKADEPVDDERVKTLLAFVLWKGMLSPEQADAAGKALYAELAGKSA